MKPIALAIILYVSYGTSSTVAHCYRYWHFKHPQHCTRGTVRVQVPPSAPTIDSNDNGWYVEIVPTEEDLRGIAIEQLKLKMGK